MEQRDIRKSSAKTTKSIEEISKTNYSSKRRKTSKYEYLREVWGCLLNWEQKLYYYFNDNRKLMGKSKVMFSNINPHFIYGWGGW